MYEFLILLWGVAILYGLAVFIRPWILGHAHYPLGIEPIKPNPQDRRRGLAIIFIAITAIYVTDMLAPRMGPWIPGLTVFVFITFGLVFGGWRDYVATKKRDKIVVVPLHIAENDEAVKAHNRSIHAQITKLDEKKRFYSLLALSALWLGIPYLGLVLVPHIFNLPLSLSLIGTAVVGIFVTIHFADEI